MVATDIGGRCSCSEKGDTRSTGVVGWVDDSMMGSVLEREDEECVEERGWG